MNSIQNALVMVQSWQSNEDELVFLAKLETHAISREERYPSPMVLNQINGPQNDRSIYYKGGLSLNIFIIFYWNT